MTRYRLAVAGTAAVVMALALASCSSTDGSPTAAPSTKVVTITKSQPSTATSAPASTPSSTPAVSPYAITSTRVTGSTDRATYDVTIPQLSGGNPAVTAEFNQSMRAALQDQIDDNYSYNFKLSDGYSKGPFHIGARVISAEQITDWIADPPGAHGDSLLATVTINTDTAKPITLQDAFGNLDAGLARLSQQAAQILPGTNAGPNYERSGMAPKLENYANWTASPEGMRIHFGDYQVGAYAAGLVSITVPWSALSDVLAPGMQDVLSS